MATKRELAAAQQELNQAVSEMCAHIGGLRADSHSDTWPPVVWVPTYLLKPVYDAYGAWDGLRSQLDGQGPAVARSTSIAAAKANIMGKQSLRRTILILVVNHWRQFDRGMTADEIMGRLRGKHQSVSARISELVNTYGLLVDTGSKAETSSGAKAIQWGPTMEAIKLVHDATDGRGAG